MHLKTHWGWIFNKFLTIIILIWPSITTVRRPEKIGNEGQVIIINKNVWQKDKTGKIGPTQDKQLT